MESSRQGSDTDDGHVRLQNNARLIVAICEGKLPKVKRLLQRGVETNVCDKNNENNTPLHLAVQLGRTEIVAELLDPKWKTNVNATNATGRTSLDIAIQRSLEDIIELLQKHRAGVSSGSENEEATVVESVQDQSETGNRENDFSLKYQKKSGTAAISGQMYEINLTTWLLLKGKSNKPANQFYLASNFEKADKFDDVVFKYENEKGQSKTIFLQAKHREKYKITSKSFMRSGKLDFILNKYFLSYQEIKQQFINKEDPKDPIFSGNFEDCEFLIYTNAPFIDTSSFIKIIEMEENDLFKIEGYQQRIFEFNFDNDLNKISEYFEHSDANEIREFLTKFKLYASQPNQKELGISIDKFAVELFKIDQQDVGAVLPNAAKKVHNWWQHEDNYLMNDNTFFEDSLRILVQFDVMEPVSSFTGRTKALNDLHKILQKKWGKDTLRRVVITGHGGIGKSELVRKYLKDYNDYYDRNVIWINAANHFTFRHSFQKLAKEKLKIDTFNENNQEKDIKVLTREVYDYFTKMNRRSIFVFDNTEKPSGEYVDKLLPSGLNKLYVIITTSDEDIMYESEKLHLNLFTQEEADEFIGRAMQKDNIKDDEVKTLIKELNYLPLALRQAVAYISVEDKKSKRWSNKQFTISCYLDEFHENANLLFSSGKIRNHTETVMTTWKTSIEKIKCESEPALEILQVMAYLLPDQIEVDEIFEKGDQKIPCPMELLGKYSMISMKARKVNIHRLVQKVTRKEIEESDQHVPILLDTLILLTSYKMDGIFKKRRIFPHIEVFLSHFERLKEQIPEEQAKIANEHHSNLLDLMVDGYKIYPERKKEFQERALALKENNYGPDDFEVVITLKNLGNTYGVLGDALKQKELLERALTINEGDCRPDHFENTYKSG